MSISILCFSSVFKKYRIMDSFGFIINGVEVVIEWWRGIIVVSKKRDTF